MTHPYFDSEEYHRSREVSDACEDARKPMRAEISALQRKNKKLEKRIVELEQALMRREDEIDRLRNA